MTSRVIYPARWAVEDAVTIPDVRPVRLFGVLWPLWEVETTAQIYDEQAYDVVDRFLVRAVHEAGLNRVDELASFFGIPVELVQRCLRFLAAIQHVQLEDGAVRLTELGVHSARAGIRYEFKESRQNLLVERFTAHPLPRQHYSAPVEVLPSWEVPPDRVDDGTRFKPLAALTPFRPELVRELAGRPDRTEINLPRFLHDLRVADGGHRDAYLPGYVIETAGSGLLAYTGVSHKRDQFFEGVCRTVAALPAMISAEDRGDPREIWTTWLAEGENRRGTLRQLPNGVWRAVLRGDAFGNPPRLSHRRIGSFVLRKHHFLQLWCEDRALRRQALLDRALGLAVAREVRDRADHDERVAGLANLLEVDVPDPTEIRAYGEQHGLHARVARLDELE